MDIVQNTAPTETQVLALVPLQKVKDNESISHTYHDDRLSDCIKSAYAFLDGKHGWLNRSILTQKWDMYMPSFADHFELPYGPLQAVDSITYQDSDDAEQTLATSSYEVITGEIVGVVRKTYNTTWPTVYSKGRAVKVTYTAGFGNANTMPFPIKVSLQRAMIVLASHFYRNPSWTYQEPRTINVNRIVHGLEHLIGFLRVPNTHR